MSEAINCTVIGQSFATNSGAFGDYGISHAYAGANSSNYYVGIIKFETPAFTGRFERLDISLYVKSQYHANIKLRYALCSSDANKLNYRQTYGEVDDEYQIASGIFSMTGMSTSAWKNYDLTIEPSTMNPGTEYYLIFWGLNNASFIDISGEVENHIIAVIYDPSFIVSVNHYAKNDDGTQTHIGSASVEVESGGSFTPTLIAPPDTNTTDGATFKAWTQDWSTYIGGGVVGVDYVVINQNANCEVYYPIVDTGSYIVCMVDGEPVECELYRITNGQPVLQKLFYKNGVEIVEI